MNYAFLSRYFVKTYSERIVKKNCNPLKALSYIWEALLFSLLVASQIWGNGLTFAHLVITFVEAHQHTSPYELLYFNVK